MRILKITPVYFMRPVVVFFRVFSLFVVHPWKLTNIPWKLMVGRWNFLLKSSLFSGDVNFQVSSPGILKEENMKKLKLRSIPRYHHQVSWGVWCFSPYPPCRPDCPFAQECQGRAGETRGDPVLGVFLEDRDHQMPGGSPWPPFCMAWFPSFTIFLVVDDQGMGPKPRWWFQFFWIFTPTWGNDPICLYNIFQMGWNHQLETYFRVSSWKRGYISEVFSFFVGGSKNLNPW